VFSVANEVAVNAFLKGRISLSRIWDLITAALEQHTALPADSLDAVQAAALEARRLVERE